MVPEYKITFFHIKALAEPIRLLFSYGGIEFEDYRFECEDWPLVKQKMPFGQVPILEYRGKIGYQSVAMARYAAKQVGLVGNNDWENLEIDMIVDTINEFRGKLYNYTYEQDYLRKEKLKIILFDEIIPWYLTKFEEITDKNNGHFALGRLTWADFYWTGMLDYFNAQTEMDLTFNRPNLRAVAINVCSIPTVKAWIDKRPDTKA